MVLVGRSAELRVLSELAEGTNRGVGAVALVEGPPGIGKTKLIETFCEVAAADGMAVASTRATALDNLLPLGSLLHALEHGSPPLIEADVLRRLSRSTLGPLWLIEELGEALEASLGDQRLAIVIDDAQWCDEVSALAMRILAPRLAWSPILWVFALRRTNETDHVAQAVRSLEGHGAATIDLGPLNRDAMMELVGSLLPDQPEQLRVDMVERCAGNPFLLEELAQSVALSRPEVVDVSLGLGSHLPADFVLTISDRLGGMTSVAVQLLRAASVLARPFEVEEISLVVGLGIPETEAAIDLCVATGALTRGREGIRFHHDLVREAFYDSCDPVDRQVLHDAAAQAITSIRGSAAESAAHLAKGSQQNQADVAAMVDGVVDVLAYQAPSAAADLIVQAAEMLEGREQASHMARAVGLLATAGQVDAAVELGEKTLAPGIDATSEAGVVLGLAQALKHGGRDTEVVAHTQRVLARSGLTKEIKAELLAVQAHALLYTDRLVDAEQAALQSMEEGGPDLAPAAYVFAGGALSVALRADGDLGRALDVARRAVQLADDHGGDAQQRHPRIWLARSLIALDRLVEAEEVLETGKREVDRFGSAWCLPLWQFYRSELRYAAGRVDDAAAEAEAGIRVAEHLTAKALIAPLSAMLCLLETLRGRFDDAEKHLDRANEMVAAGAGTMIEDVAWPAGFHYWMAGRSDAAFASLKPIYELMPERLSMLADDPSAAAVLVRVASKVGQDADAERVVATARALADKNPDVLVMQAAAAHALGLQQSSIENLETAVELYADGARPLAGTAAEVDLGAALIADGQAKRGLELMSSGCEIYDQMGCVGMVDQVRAEIERLGSSPSNRRSGRAIGWDSLTDAELRVARLVAAGKTNRAVASELFLSPHTIDSHLRHVFSKLSISSRVDLTRLVIENDGT